MVTELARWGLVCCSRSVCRYCLSRPCGHPATGADEFRPNWVESSALGRQRRWRQKRLVGAFGSQHPTVMTQRAFRSGGRPIPLPKLALSAAVALAALSLSPGSAHAACASGTPSGTCRVTVGGMQYDVTTFTGSYNGNTSKFAQPPAPGGMPWWGSSNLANQFAAAVGNGFGVVRPAQGFGPFFAYRLSPVTAEVFIPGPNIVFSGQRVSNTDSSSVWAQATPVSQDVSVPGPLPLFGAGAALGFSRKLRKRIQESRVPVGSDQLLV